MKRTLLICALALAPLATMAQTTPSAKAPDAKEKEHTNEDVARHRIMAKAHEEAARAASKPAPRRSSAIKNCAIPAKGLQ